MPYTYVNRATALLGATLSDSATSIAVATGKGALFAGASVANPIRCKIVEGTTVEIVDVTARSTDTLTLVRGVEAPDGSTAAAGTAFTAAARITACVTAEILEDAREWDEDPFRRSMRVALLEWDYLNSVGTPFSAAQSGAGAGSTYIPAADRPGVIRVSTGTDTTGRAMQWAFASNIDIVRFGQGFEYRFKALIKLSALSDGTDEYDAWFGFSDGSGSIGTRYCVFRYDRNTNVNWLCHTNTGSVVDSGVPVTTDWLDLEIQVNAAGTLARFLIDGVEVGTEATLPTANVTAMKAEIRKSAGTTARYFDLDYMGLATIMPTRR